MITSSSNPRIKQVCALIKKAREREKTGLFTAEGMRIFSEIPAELISEVYVSESFEREKGEFLSGIAYETVSNNVFDAMCDTKGPQGILAVVKKPKYMLSDLTKGNPLLVILENLQDPGNVGTIFRTAEGAGATGIIISRDTCDIFSPKCVRSTMGSLFRLPFIVAGDLFGTVKELQTEGVSVYAAHLKGKTEYTKPDYGKKTAFVIGNEGNGITDGLADLCDTLVSIPMEGKLESLNAAIAGAVLLYKAHENRSYKKV